jgi:hypothetical protein
MKTVLFFLFTLPLMALPEDLEENVAYVEEFAPKGIKLKVAKPGWVYSTNKGGRKRGSLKVGIDVELVSFTEKAYFDGSPRPPFLQKTPNSSRNSNKSTPANSSSANSSPRRKSRLA